jgi:SAM-dependent methyltransferase
MPIEDQLRWDERYRAEPRYSRFERPRHFLVRHSRYLPAAGLALDLAMGLGGNAEFLLSHGLRVVGVDRSGVAVQKAKHRMPALMAVHADLADFPLPNARFDVVLNFYYLQRDLWPRIESALRPGGVLFYETLTREMLAINATIDPQFLLAPGELGAAFPGLDTLEYVEGWTAGDSGHRRAVAALIARKPVIPGDERRGLLR